eukprot:2466372-Rhodomonas_salina.1
MQTRETKKTRGKARHVSPETCTARDPSEISEYQREINGRSTGDQREINRSTGNQRRTAKNSEEQRRTRRQVEITDPLPNSANSKTRPENKKQ